MKQHITQFDLSQLSPKATKRYFNWVKHNPDFAYDEKTNTLYHSPLLSIGQMIQFLNKNNLRIERVDHEFTETWYLFCHNSLDNDKKAPFKDISLCGELCDIL